MSLEDVQTYGIISTSKLSFPGESYRDIAITFYRTRKEKGGMKWTYWTCSVDVYPHVICVDVVQFQFRFELLDRIWGFESVVMIFQQPWVSIQLDFTSVMTFESPWRYSGIAFGWPHVAFRNLNVSTLATDFKRWTVVYLSVFILLIQKNMHALDFCPHLTKGFWKNQEKPTRKKQDFCQPRHVPQHHIPPKKNLIQSVTFLSPNVGLVTLKQPFQKGHRFHIANNPKRSTFSYIHHHPPSKNTCKMSPHMAPMQDKVVLAQIQIQRSSLASNVPTSSYAHPWGFSERDIHYSRLSGCHFVDRWPNGRVNSGVSRI